MRPFIQAFLDAVLHYLQREPTDIQQFLVWWDNQGSKFSLPRMQEQDAISIMTIHQAKGLQFKIVILPFCDWSFDHSAQNSPIIWCASSADPFSQLPILPLRYNKSLKNTLYANYYYEERMQTYLDNLNLLYVAFTRPEDRLYIFTQQPAKPAFKTISDLLLHVFTQKDQLFKNQKNGEKKYLTWKQYWDDDTHILTLGMPKPVNNTSDQKTVMHTAPFLLNHWHSQLTIERNTGLKNDQAKRTYKQSMQIAWIADILTKLQTTTQLKHKLINLQLEQGLSPIEINSIKQHIESLWQDPCIKSWYDGSWFMPPHTFLLAPAGKVYQPNRVMTQQNKALAVSWITYATSYEQAYKQVEETAHLLIKMQYVSVNTYLLDIPNQTLYTL